MISKRIYGTWFDGELISNDEEFVTGIFDVCPIQ